MQRPHLSTLLAALVVLSLAAPPAPAAQILRGRNAPGATAVEGRAVPRPAPPAAPAPSTPPATPQVGARARPVAPPPTTVAEAPVMSERTPPQRVVVPRGALAPQVVLPRASAVPRVVIPRVVQPRVNIISPFYRPYYRFRPRFSLGFGLWVGYPVAYPYYYPYAAYPYPYVIYPYPYPYPPSAYPYPYPSYPYPYPSPGYPSTPYPPATPGAAPPPAPATGGVSFEVTPPEAGVYVDGQYVGMVGSFTPTSEPLALFPGRHHVEIREPGYRTLAFDVDIAAGQVIPYQGVLQRQ